MRKSGRQVSRGLCSEYKVISDIPQENIVNTKSSFTFLFVQFKMSRSDLFNWFEKVLRHYADDHDDDDHDDDHDDDQNHRHDHHWPSRCFAL